MAMQTGECYENTFQNLQWEDCILNHCKGEEHLFMFYYSYNRKCFLFNKIMFYLPEITSPRTASNSGKNFLTTSGEKIWNVSQLLSREEEIQTPDFPLLYRLLQSFCSCFHVCFWRNEQLVPLWLISILQEIMFQLMPAQATLAIRQF